jgi:hypothetical protein
MRAHPPLSLDLEVMLLMENVDSKDIDQRSNQPKLYLLMNIMSAIFTTETGLQNNK